MTQKGRVEKETAVVGKDLFFIIIMRNKSEARMAHSILKRPFSCCLSVVL